jgi:hypothetical protein
MNGKKQRIDCNTVSDYDVLCGPSNLVHHLPAGSSYAATPKIPENDRTGARF